MREYDGENNREHQTYFRYSLNAHIFGDDVDEKLSECQYSQLEGAELSSNVWIRYFGGVDGDYGECCSFANSS